jgi:hypothetical protein
MCDVAAVVAAAASSRGIGAGGDLVCVFIFSKKFCVLHSYCFLLFTIVFSNF